MSAPAILRRQLLTQPSHTQPSSFIPQVRRIVFAVSDTDPAHAGLREFLRRGLVPLARANPHVELCVEGVAKGRKGCLGVKMGGWIRGEYINQREKHISLLTLPAHKVAEKVELLLSASGNKIVPLKRRTVESTNESVRGIWSQLHDTTHEGGGWKI